MLSSGRESVGGRRARARMLLHHNYLAEKLFLLIMKERKSYGKCLLFWFYNLLTMVGRRCRARVIK